MSSTAFHFDVDRYINPFIPRSRLNLLPKPISWFLGYRDKPQAPVGNVLVWWWALLGGFCSILVIEAVFQTERLKMEGTPIIIASLGAAAILEFNTIASPLAQPRNIFLGSIFSAVTGVSITKLFQLSPHFEGLRWVSGALSVGVASAVMGLTNTIHPPAGATALLASASADITDLGWRLIPLIILGNVLMLGVACVLNNIQRQFPIYWWTAADLSPPKPKDIDVEKIIGEEVEIAMSNLQHHVEGDTKIMIDDERIIIPNWIELNPEEISILEVLRLRLHETLKQTSTRTSDRTQGGDR